MVNRDWKAMDMPIYEYRCSKCRRCVTIFVQTSSASLAPVCTWCGSQDLVRLFSTFVIGKGETYKRKGLYEDILSDQQLTRGMMANDPRALVEWNRRMSRGTDEETAPEYEEMLGRLEAGEPVHQVMQTLNEAEEPT